MADQPIQMSSGIPTTVLPEADPALRHELEQALTADDGRAAVSAFVASHPRSLEGWASHGDLGRDVMDRYAAYRVGYHRGLDSLRKNGWKGSGYVRSGHPGNEAFLRCLSGLSRMAGAIGEDDERDRCAEFLAMLDPGRSSDGS